ncbi:hypothetical protein [Micromonospora sp. NPDC049662]|uniref:hypothetical protein n=1 Tax=Micromonospora sp. NPDC049662 TaxID=3155397 RepID=UPI00344243BA
MQDRPDPDPAGFPIGVRADGTEALHHPPLIGIHMIRDEAWGIATGGGKTNQARQLLDKLIRAGRATIVPFDPDLLPSGTNWRRPFARQVETLPSGPVRRPPVADQKPHPAAPPVALRPGETWGRVTLNEDSEAATWPAVYNPHDRDDNDFLRPRFTAIQAEQLRRHLDAAAAGEMDEPIDTLSWDADTLVHTSTGFAPNGTRLDGEEPDPPVRIQPDERGLYQVTGYGMSWDVDPATVGQTPAPVKVRFQVGDAVRQLGDGEPFVVTVLEIGTTDQCACDDCLIEPQTFRYLLPDSGDDEWAHMYEFELFWRPDHD